MKKPLVIAAIAAVIALGGGAAAVAVVGSEPQPASTSEVAENTQGTQADTPAAIATATPEVAEDKPRTAEEAELLGYLRGGTALYEPDLFTDKQLLEAAHNSCDLFAEGVDYEAMDVVSGDESALTSAGLGLNRNDREIASLASQLICPEYSIAN